MRITRDEPLANEGTEESDAVQLKPQEIIVNIRPKAKVTFDVTYRQAVDYPVDLYYLMDLSYSMNDDKEKLSELGDSLAARMRNITKNFRLGFGSFIDKKLMPFIDPRPEKQRSPCPVCAEPYGFKNQMSLTTNTERFSKEVEKAEISGNLDAPEGGFDAVMQALSCNEDIGWRERARKMVVFSTDAGFHYAGDGRLAGLVVPNDGQCHLDNRGYYTKSLDQDYPSIALLHQRIRERKANLIFAVTEKNLHLYEQLRDALPDVSSSVGVLADDSRNMPTTDKECPPPVPVLAIVLGVIAGIVILGLILLLVWKLLTVLHDRAEYARFENERLMAKWDTGENPIYKQATTTFKNPAYGGKQ
uniref:Integrin beta n=1 Tax=Plectus sambesii TaxID=2011161 RepID=A0A914XQU9_9BILA